TTVGSELELVEQARFAHPRLSHHPDDLPMPRLGLLQGFLHLPQLALPPHKAGKPPPGRDLQPGAQWPNTQYFVYGDGLGDPFDLRLAEGFTLEIALDQFVGVLTYDDCTPTGQTLHARG